MSVSGISDTTSVSAAYSNLEEDEEKIQTEAKESKSVTVKLDTADKVSNSDPIEKLAMLLEVYSA